MDVQRRQRGFSAHKLAGLAGFFIIASSLGSLLVRPTGSGYADAGLGLLTVGIVMEVISWCAIPLVAWLYTLAIKRGVNRWRLAAWTFLIAAVSEVPYDLASERRVWSTESQNPVWVLLIALVVLAAIDITAQLSTAARWAAMLGVTLAAVFWIVALSLGTRFGIIPMGIALLGFIMIFYLLWGSENRMMYSAGAFGAAMFISPALGTVFLHYRQPLLDEEGSLPAAWIPWAYPAVLLCAGLIATVLM
ncbi:TraX family protein [Corynebacterium silvaticum]|uniref:TraX family protein n=1 Tax=Corynebacterium silvaticum TaxID=2320431 RepID=A0A7Y4P9N7_9CORY|nr:TraX family protein [Corynebacterium silvaticum]ARU45539.1 TraX family protein [Corynebacterium silvaticum]MBH5300118.1 traX [Corynebacterium silvaticum]NOM65881.1 traX [Corynebacterium silvaticum]NON70515.1 traX [Corynebacterium silvaticum]TFA91335.1 traX [Corynebacterium silvaticum]